MPHEATAQRAAGNGGAALSYALSAKFVGQPLALRSDNAMQLQFALNSGKFDPQILVSGTGASKFLGAVDNRSRYRVTADGVALVAIAGTLIDRGAFLGDMWGYITTYEGLAEQFRRLAKDDSVQSVILDIDSPGGMVAGLFDLMAEIEDLKRKKKVVAVAANMAASAAYAIGCAAHELYVSELGLVGSIGTLKIHTSYERMLAESGIETTIVHAGRNKANGNPYQALTDLARCEMHAEVDMANERFVAHVAKHRPLDAAAVLALEARCVFGSEAVEAKLADGVMSVELALEKIRNGSKSARGQTPKSNGGRMSDNPASAATSADANAFTAALAAAVAALTVAKPAAAPAEAPAAAAAVAPAVAPAAVAAAVAPAVASAAAAPVVASEKDRFKAIMQSDAGKARPTLAQHFALETDMPAEAAIAALAVAPVEAAVAAVADPLAARMADPKNSGGVQPDSVSGAQAQSFVEFAAKAPQRR